jgi:tRNA modification GTPase
MALVEAGIDFADEADVPGDLIAPALETARELADEIAAALADGRRGERLRDGLVVAIAGPPNAGKSSLLNRIARRDVAIVSPHAGTTRDVIEVHLDLQGYPVTLLDTAGIRHSEDPVEQEGVRRAQARAADADLVLWLSDATAPSTAPPKRNESVPIWWIRNKVDLAAGAAEPRFGTIGQRSFEISALHGTGVDDLLAELSLHASSVLQPSESVLITRERHRRVLQDAWDALRRALNSARNGAEDLIAEELRLAARALGRLTGRVDVEDILDVIFRDFCIGK